LVLEGRHYFGGVGGVEKQQSGIHVAVRHPVDVKHEVGSLQYVLSVLVVSVGGEVEKYLSWAFVADGFAVGIYHFDFDVEGNDQPSD
jgi:hypothetical protein